MSKSAFERMSGYWLRREASVNELLRIPRMRAWKRKSVVVMILSTFASGAELLVCRQNIFKDVSHSCNKPCLSMLVYGLYESYRCHSMPLHLRMRPRREQGGKNLHISREILFRVGLVDR